MGGIYKKLCVFCGNKLQNKTKEHIIPKWLIEMTGDPHRRVTFGFNYENKRTEIKFDWLSFVSPACDECNNRYAKMESDIKQYVIALKGRKALTASQYIELLNWMDKVRIGIWLALQPLERHPLSCSPNFYIDSRIAKKDRMIAVYVLDGEAKGINLFGSESMIFRKMPSCFGLRIDNLLLLNISSDFFCSKGCGLPAPENMSLIVDGKDSGKISLEGVEYHKKVSHRITNISIKKPVVWLYQPIYFPNNKTAFDDFNVFQGGYYGHYNLFDSYILSKTMNTSHGMGILFRQLSDRVELIDEDDVMINFDEVNGCDVSTAGEIVSTIYKTQIELRDMFEFKSVTSNASIELHQKIRSEEFDSNMEYAKMYENLSNDKVVK